MFELEPTRRSLISPDIETRILFADLDWKEKEEKVTGAVKIKTKEELEEEEEE